MSESDTTPANGIRRAFDAVANGDLATLFTLDDVNLVNDAGRSLLAAALVKREPPVVLVLLQKGADTNGTTEREGMPVLHFCVQTGAVGSGGIELCELLLQHGADVRAVDRKGNSVLHVAADQGAVSLYASYMTQYLLGAGAAVGAVNAAGETALHRAVRTVSKGAVAALVRTGCPVAVKDRNGRTAADLAGEHWHGDEEYGHLASEYARILSGASQPE
jgi:ankyrin repeat protein